MRVKLQPMGLYKKYLKDGPEEYWIYELETSICLGELLEKSLIEFGKTQPLVLVNGLQKKKDYMLVDEDHVVVMITIGGG